MSRLEEVGNGLFAYRQRDAGWGWSNAGLVVDGDATLLVDTLFDLKLSRAMLDTMRAAVPAAREIGTVVNTHANGDHCYGNALVGGAGVVASAAAAEEMRQVPPSLMAALKDHAPEMGRLGEFVLDCFGPFDWAGIELPDPDETFRGRLTLNVGDREVRLLEVGPAHTRGDVLVHLPADGVVFSGDIVFGKLHPVAWADVEGWRRALEALEALAPTVVVPGHGPVGDLGLVREERAYWDWLEAEARERWERGLDPLAAARDLPADPRWEGWGERERLAVNVATLFRRWDGDESPPNLVELFGLMAELVADR